MANFNVNHPVQSLYESDREELLTEIRSLKAKIGNTTPSLAIVKPQVTAAGKASSSGTSSAAGSSSSSGGTVKSVTVTSDSVIFGSPTGNPVKDTGTINLPAAKFPAHQLPIGPTTGADAVPTIRVLIAADLPNTAVTPGSYTNVSLTVDAQGRITLATNGTGTGDQVLHSRPTISPGSTLTITQSCVIECAPSANMTIIVPDASTLSYGLRITVIKDDGVTGNGFTVTIQCASTGTIRRLATKVLSTNGDSITMIAAPAQNNYNSSS